MSEDTAALTVTLKASGGYDSPWIVVRGDNPDEVANRLRSLDAVIEATHEAAGLFAAGRLAQGNIVTGTAQDTTLPPTSQPAQQGWGQTPAAQQQTQQNAAPAQQGPKLHPTDTCAACGQRPQEKDVWRKSDNKKFEFWTCPNQKSRDDGHYSAFRN